MTNRNTIPPEAVTLIQCGLAGAITGLVLFGIIEWWIR
jgi:hypothetical protein